MWWKTIYKFLAVTLAMGLTVSIGIFSFAQDEAPVTEKKTVSTGSLAYLLDNMVADKNTSVDQYQVKVGETYLITCNLTSSPQTKLIKVTRVFEDPVRLLGFEVRTNRTIVGINQITDMTEKISISGAGGFWGVAILHPLIPVTDPSSQLTLRDQLGMYF